MFIRNLFLLFFAFCLSIQSFADSDAPTLEEAKAALDKAVTFFTEEVSTHGGYVWCYSADLSKREGEGKVGETTAWLQPPGTPYVGEALIELYELTGDRNYLAKARETAMALVSGQLHSGGWYNRIEFDPDDRDRFAYRIDGPPSKRARNTTTLDDDMTQAALRFLIRFDKTTNFKEEKIHEAVMYGLDSLVDVQFPNGAWPHVFEEPIDDPSRYPVKPADYREDGEYTRIKQHWRLYTINDRLMSDVIETLFLAAQTYDDERYLKAAKKGGDFLILAQMPEPQPGWVQQYDFDMHPAWARKFEPPSITGGESQQVMMTLMDIYEKTGDKKYLEPIPKALKYYKDSLLPDGRLARFYELKTNKPLYFTRDYELTYSDDDMPTHYGFKVSSKLDRIEKRYKALANSTWSPPDQSKKSVPKPSPEKVRDIIKAIDERGAWVEKGHLRYWDDDATDRIIDPRTFVNNSKILARYIYYKR